MTIKIWISIQRLSVWVVGLGWVIGWVGGWMGHKMGPPTRLQLRLFGLLESLHIVSNLVCTCPGRRMSQNLAMHPFLDTSQKQFVAHVASVECSRKGVFVDNLDI